jgi:hypothetical protein
MSGHETVKIKPNVKIVKQVEIAGRNAAALSGGAIGATLAYYAGEALFRTTNFLVQANEAGLISESSGLTLAEGVKTAGLAYAAFKTGMWSFRMHNIARAIESGKRPTSKKH